MQQIKVNVAGQRHKQPRARPIRPLDRLPHHLRHPTTICMQNPASPTTSSEWRVGLPLSCGRWGAWQGIWGRCHGGRRPSRDDSFHSPTVIPPSALDKPSIMKRYHRQWTCSNTSPRRSPTMVTLHDARFVECRWWNDGWTVKTVVTWRSSTSMIPVSGVYCNNCVRL